MAHPKIPDKSTTENPPRLLDQVRDKLRVKHYSIRTVRHAAIYRAPRKTARFQVEISGPCIGHRFHIIPPSELNFTA